MRRSNAVADEVRRFLDETLSAEIEIVHSSFGASGFGMKRMAAKTAAETVKKKYPGIIVEPVVIPLWEAMSAFEKVKWWIARILLPNRFKYMYFEEYLRQYELCKSQGRPLSNPPSWLVPDPKKEEIINFWIGIR